MSSTNTLTTRRVFGGGFDQPVARVAAGVVSWSGAVYQGSVRQVLVNAGNIIAASGFDAHGNLTSGSLTDRYAAREWDTSLGLYYQRARMYAPAIGRIYSEDPTQFAAGDANLQRYTGNGPTNATDPSGARSISRRSRIAEADPDTTAAINPTATWRGLRSTHRRSPRQNNLDN